MTVEYVWPIGKRVTTLYSLLRCTLHFLPVFVELRHENHMFSLLRSKTESRILRGCFEQIFGALRKNSSCVIDGKLVSLILMRFFSTGGGGCTVLQTGMS